MFGLALLASALAGCAGNECNVGEHRCEGDMALNCEAPEEQARVFRSLPCGSGECKTDEASAFCTVSTAPEPACASGVQEVCVGSSLVECNAGYALSTYDCASGAFVFSPSSAGQNGSAWLLDITATAQSTTCIGAGQRAFCAAAAETSTECETGHLTFDFPDERGTVVCSGNDAVACVNGYEVSRTNCADSFCVISDERAQCALSNAPDPKCPMGANVPTTYCEGDVVVNCSGGGYRVSKDPCATGETCATVQFCSGPSPICTGAVCTTK